MIKQGDLFLRLTILHVYYFSPRENAQNAVQGNPSFLNFSFDP